MQDEHTQIHGLLNMISSLERKTIKEETQELLFEVIEEKVKEIKKQKEKRATISNRSKES